MLNHQDVIPLKSPLALTGIFLDIMLRRFREDAGLSWVYYPGDEGRVASTITIEAATNPEIESFGKRPGLYIIRNPVTFNQVAIDDLADHNRKTGGKQFYCVAQTGVTFAVESDKSGEAELIADVVASTLLMGSNEIERFFLLRKIGPISISSKAYTRQDTDISRVDIHAGITYDVHWSSTPIAPILKEILVSHTAAAYNSNDAYFVEMYQESLAYNPKAEICDEVGMT